MRYYEIVEAATGEKVWKATQRRHAALRTYHDQMNAIPKTTPAPKVGEKQAKAREKCQTAVQGANDAARSALSKA